MFNYHNLLLATLLLFATCMASASLWQPADTDAQVNIASSNPNVQIGVFSADDINSNAQPLLTFNGIGAVKFVKTGDSWEISDGDQAVKLGASQKFHLGWYANGNWITDANSHSSQLEADVLQINLSNDETLTVSNIKPSETLPFTEIHINNQHLSIPVWIMLSLFISYLAYEKHRRRHQDTAIYPKPTPPSAATEQTETHDEER